MRHGSLFSGIGGFDLAAQWMGWENVFHCEWNKFGQQVLKYYWPNSISYDDITKTDFTIHRGNIDLITGGFPCQPYSSAGRRRGKEDERHLWPQMLRAIREISPRWVVGENVRGLTNWNGGLVFDEVQADLEAEGYEVLPFLLPACAVNAPHRRDRIWFVAHSNNKSKCENSNNRKREDCKQKSYDRNEVWNNIGSIITNEITTDTECIRLQYGTEAGKIFREKRISKKQGDKSTLSIKTNGHGYQSKWENFPTVSPICNGNDGFSSKLDGITFSKWRNESIKAGGNAIVPQVVYQIFKAIEEYERITHPDSN